MLKNIKVHVIIFVLVVFASCEGGTTYTKTIENKSSDTILLTIFSAYLNDQSFTINPNDSQEIYWDDQMGSFVGDSYSCTQEIDSMEITISNNKVLMKDIMNSVNWIRESKDGRNSREDCTFIITDEDLQ